MNLRENPKDFDPLTSKKLLAEELGVNLSTLWRWEKDGVIPKSVRIGGRVGWPRSVLRKWKIEQGWPAFDEANGPGDAA